MTQTSNRTGRASSIPCGLMSGALISVMITGIMTGILAILISKDDVQWELVGYGILVMVMLSSFMGAIVAYRKIRRQRLIVSLMSGAVYYGILLSITALFFGGKYEAVGVTGLLILGGSTCAGIVGKGGGEVHRKIRRSYR